MLDLFESWDREIFLLLNGYHSDWLDFVMWHISGKLEWIPLYLVLLYLIIKKFGKLSWIVLLGAGLLITLADQVSVQLFKEVFERYRPCHNLEINELVHIVNNKCGGKFGFVSSHAANSFAIATFIGLLLSHQAKKNILVVLLLWATLVSYSRIYLGVHYPSDVIGGALLGMILAQLFYKICIAFIKSKMKNA